MITKLPKLSLPALIGIVLGGLLIVFVEPETASGASILGAIGLVPSLIIGYLLSKLDKTKQSSKNPDSNNDA